MSKLEALAEKLCVENQTIFDSDNFSTELGIATESDITNMLRFCMNTHILNFSIRSENPFISDFMFFGSRQ